MIEIGDVVAFCVKNNLQRTLDALKVEAQDIIPTDPLLLKYNQLKQDYKRLLDITRQLALQIEESDPNIDYLLLKQPSTPNMSKKPSYAIKDAIKPTKQVPKVTSRQIAEIVKSGPIKEDILVQIVDDLMDNHEWQIEDVKQLLLISRYWNARNKLEPTLTLESLARCINPNTQPMVLKCLMYLSAKREYVLELQQRHMLDYFTFYSQEHNDVQGLAFLMLNISESCDYLEQYPVLSVNLLMDCLELGNDMSKVAAIITISNIIHNPEVRKYFDMLSIMDVLDHVQTPKLKTPIDHLRLKIYQKQPKQFDYTKDNILMDFDTELVEDYVFMV